MLLTRSLKRNGARSHPVRLQVFSVIFLEFCSVLPRQLVCWFRFQCFEQLLPSDGKIVFQLCPSDGKIVTASIFYCARRAGLGFETFFCEDEDVRIICRDVVADPAVRTTTEAIGGFI